jgi:hypothetical protein
VFPTEQDRLHGSLMRPYRLIPYLELADVCRGRALLLPIEVTSSNRQRPPFAAVRPRYCTAESRAGPIASHRKARF